MVADIDGRRDDELLRGVEAIAGQAAPLVADEVPALRIGDVVGQAAPFEPEAVGQGVVAAHVLDQHRMDSRRLVEVPAGRQAAVAEQLRVHPDGADPLAIGCPFGRLGDPGDEVSDGRHAGVSRVDRGQLRAGEREVVMRVDEARQDRPPGDVDHLRIGRSGGTRGVVAADGDDPVADDRDAAAERRFAGPGREHASVEQDKPAHPAHLRTGQRANHVHCSSLRCGLRCIRPDEGARHGAHAAGRCGKARRRRIEHASMDNDRRIRSRLSAIVAGCTAEARRHLPPRDRRQRWCLGRRRGLGGLQPASTGGRDAHVRLVRRRLPGGAAQGLAGAVHRADGRAVHRG